MKRIRNKIFLFFTFLLSVLFLMTGFTVSAEENTAVSHTAKVQITCTEGCGGWNSSTIPVHLMTAGGNVLRWDVPRDSLKDTGQSVTKTFSLGEDMPVGVEMFPDFGGGMTFRNYAAKVMLWLDDSSEAMESGSINIRSGLFTSSLSGGDYLKLDFTNYGKASVGIRDENGAVSWKGSYIRCTDAWNVARNLGKNAVVRLDSPWMIGSALELYGSTEITLDLNGYPLIRSAKKLESHGEVIRIDSSCTLHITDSQPESKFSRSFRGGSIQGGRTKDGGGLFYVYGKLDMKGGTLYNGGTDEHGGAIYAAQSADITLENVLISDCWSKTGWTSWYGGAIYLKENADLTMKNCTIRNCECDNYGGAIYMRDEMNRVILENVTIQNCKTLKDHGGAIYQNNGMMDVLNSTITGCQAPEGEGGAIYQNDGRMYLGNSVFTQNRAKKDGGAVYSNTNIPTWMVSCTFTGNASLGGKGGAIYCNHQNNYMESCTVTNNASYSDGGGIFLASSTSIDLSGVCVIKDNDGKGNSNNLVLTNGIFSNGYVYDAGLSYGSEVHLCSDDNGSSYKLSEAKISQFQISQYFRADKGSLQLKETETKKAVIVASVFTEHTFTISAGIFLLAAAFCYAGWQSCRKRKGSVD